MPPNSCHCTRIRVGYRILTSYNACLTFKSLVSISVVQQTSLTGLLTIQRSSRTEGRWKRKRCGGHGNAMVVLGLLPVHQIANHGSLLTPICYYYTSIGVVRISEILALQQEPQGYKFLLIRMSAIYLIVFFVLIDNKR